MRVQIQLVLEVDDTEAAELYGLAPESHGRITDEVVDHVVEVLATAPNGSRVWTVQTATVLHGFKA